MCEIHPTDLRNNLACWTNTVTYQNDFNPEIQKKGWKPLPEGLLAFDYTLCVVRIHFSLIIKSFW